MQARRGAAAVASGQRLRARRGLTARCDGVGQGVSCAVPRGSCRMSGRCERRSADGLQVNASVARAVCLSSKGVN